MKPYKIFCELLLIFSSIILVKTSDYPENSNFSQQYIETTLHAILDVFRKIKDSDLYRLLDDIPSHHFGIEIKKGFGKENIGSTGSAGCLLKPSNCAELQLNGFTTNGIYEIFPRGNNNGKHFSIYCDFKTDGGGWTVFQRRGNFGEPKENFQRIWKDYKFGFGDLNKEFWLGNEIVSVLTSNDRMTMRVDLEDFEGDIKFAEYKDFIIEKVDYSYRMSYRDYSGSAGDSLAHHKGHSFSTFDKDNVNKCATMHKGGWWYNKCHSSNLNGLYFNETDKPNTTCTNWSTFKGDRRCMKSTEMKLRPNYFDEIRPL